MSSACDVLLLSGCGHGREGKEDAEPLHGQPFLKAVPYGDVLRHAGRRLGLSPGQEGSESRPWENEVESKKDEKKTTTGGGGQQEEKQYEGNGEGREGTVMFWSKAVCDHVFRIQRSRSPKDPKSRFGDCRGSTA